MTDSAKFKNLDALVKRFGDQGLRYRADDRTGAVSIADEKNNNWLRVDEGDTIEKYGNGFTVVRQGDERDRADETKAEKKAKVRGQKEDSDESVANEDKAAVKADDKVKGK